LGLVPTTESFCAALSPHPVTKRSPAGLRVAGQSRTGQRDRRHHEYRFFSRLLHDELGLAPSPQLKEAPG
jgi:hypothetical protein